MKVRCPICESESQASQERMREIARLGLVRFLVIARKARIQVTMEEQVDLYQALLDWDCVGLPCEVDWLIDEYADRAMHYAILAFDLDPRLIAVKRSMPSWDANWNNPHAWNIPAEHRIADQLEPILRDADAWPDPAHTAATTAFRRYFAGRNGLPDLRNDAVDPEGDDID